MIPEQQLLDAWVLAELQTRQQIAVENFCQRADMLARIDRLDRLLRSCQRALIAAVACGAVGWCLFWWRIVE